MQLARVDYLRSRTLLVLSGVPGGKPWNEVRLYGMDITKYCLEIYRLEFPSALLPILPTNSLISIVDNSCPQKSV